MRTTWRSIVVLFLAGGLLAGCASTQEPAEQPIEEPPPQAAPTPTLVYLGFFEEGRPSHRISIPVANRSGQAVMCYLQHFILS